MSQVTETLSKQKTIMRSKSISASTPEMLRSFLNETIKNDFHPTLAITFSDPEFGIDDTIEIFKSHDIQLIGCSTSGEICNDELNEETFSALLLDLNPTSFKIISFEAEGNDYSTQGRELGKIANETFDNPGIIVYSGGIGVDGESIVKGIKSTMEREIPIHGGQGADHFRYQKVSTYTHESNNDNGLSALILDTDKVRMMGKTFSGWNDLGKIHTITKSEANIIYEIDGKPALDLFNSYFPSIEYKQQDDSEKLFTIPGIYPLKILRDDDVVIIRSGMIYDFENKALILAGGVQQGDQFKFCPTPSFDVVDTTLNQFSELAKDTGEVDAVIINSCAGRHFAFGPMFEDEVEGLYNIWKKPTVGYMAYGEIGNIGQNSICEFHNVSCSLVTLTGK